jgi:hypothetical protein
MGYDSVSDLGLHSIRKGATSYPLASLPGEPSPDAICLQGGWTMGQVKDIYFHQMQSGDKFAGRCISLLNMMSGEFASSPAFFKEDTDEELISRTVNDVFPHFQTTPGMGRILQMCTASLIYHRETVLSFDANHAAKTVSIFRDGSITAPVTNKIMVVKAWESNRHLTGMPAHVKELVDLQALRDEQTKLSDTIFTKVMGGLTEYFDTRRIGSGEMTEARIKELISLVRKANMDKLVKCVETTVNSLKTAFEECSFGNGPPCRQDDGEDNVVRNATCQLRANTLGGISRLPSDLVSKRGHL